jgi:hypothetical protein
VEVLGRYSKLAKLDITALTTSGRPCPVATPPRIHAAKRRLGSAQVAQLVADYQAGQTTTQLMASYGIGKGTVLRLLETAGIPRRNQPLTPEQCAEAIRLYQQGWSLARVGLHLGRDDSLIHLVLQRAGIPRRDSHGRQR